MRPLVAVLLAVLVPPTFVATALTIGHDPIAAAADAPLIHREAGYVGSTTCKQCHPDQHASWAGTFHSTMTQMPSERSVLGAFDGKVVQYGRDRARPFRAGERFLMEVADGNGGQRTAEVVLTVGSRRYQQYFERQPRGDGAVIVRLPILWHQELRRWLPLETVFLGPDVDGMGHHAAEWNTNCILCHNTGPRPGLLDAHDPARLRQGNRFASEVAELGIACEACHGPGAEHAASARNPFARYVGTPHHAFHPAQLGKEQAVAICGQCHGARLPNPPKRATEWFTTGPTFRPGDRLLDHVTPIVQSTPMRGGDPEAFALRFWGEGTPRLTAYEYQGVVASKCYTKGDLTCQSCHAMHAGDPRGQLRPDLQGDAMCTQCHAEIARDVRAHTHHAPDGAGSRCVACHMPKIVYGVMDIHRSHRIDVPDPARDGAAGRPNACTLCHVDRSLPWAATAMREWWGSEYQAPTRRFDGAPMELADAAASLFAGDAAARAVAAKAFGEPGATFGDDHAAAVRAWLAVTLGDGYPTVRQLARRSLLALESRNGWKLGERVHGVDHLAPPERRRDDVFGLLDAIARSAPERAPRPASTALLGVDFRLDLPGVIRLTDLQGRNLIAIGE
jgi:predicted CXXCH cytochrome family protein